MIRNRQSWAVSRPITVKSRISAAWRNIFQVSGDIGMFSQRQRGRFSRGLFVTDGSEIEAPLTLFAHSQQSLGGLESYPPVWISQELLQSVKGCLNPDPTRCS